MRISREERSLQVREKLLFYPPVPLTGTRVLPGHQNKRLAIFWGDMSRNERNRKNNENNRSLRPFCKRPLLQCNDFNWGHPRFVNQSQTASLTKNFDFVVFKANEIQS